MKNVRIYKINKDHVHHVQTLAREDLGENHVTSYAGYDSFIGHTTGNL